MKPVSITLFESLKFVGLKACIRSSQEARNDLSSIPVLWQQLRPQFPQLSSRLGSETYALIEGDLPSGKKEKAFYYALVRVSEFNNVPSNFVTFEIPKGRMAKFLYQGRPEMVGHSVYKALGEWLPESKESLSENLELFVYPANYNRTNPESSFEFCLFLK